ncbi:hypothetical protein [Lewinella sp. IMCC34191]|uniref:hypothetical protein n=1 Tax=Lewinella sp. IMCC34191 TaxID=2259172 RepID=UPI000E288935|nr:hypothetical protein [Lewinella sp. IMCC34191]
MVVAKPTLQRTATLFAELQDLKRLQPAHYPFSISTHLFRLSWHRWINGEDVVVIARDVLLKALLSVRFPGLDGRFYAVARLTGERTEEILREALRMTVEDAISEELYTELSEHLSGMLPALTAPRYPSEGELPAPLEALCRQPRAGATHPDRPRLVLLPPEMHSDHCLLTAVYAAIMADQYGGNRGTVFLAGLAHHLHNAYLPDCGFAGEICLGPDLDDIVNRCRGEALQHFDAEQREAIRHALTFHESIARPEGKAISAGDVMDRVLDVKWRTRAAAVTDATVLGELDLVHPGPLKDFQSELLQASGLWMD